MPTLVTKKLMGWRCAASAKYEPATRDAARRCRDKQDLHHRNFPQLPFARLMLPFNIPAIQLIAKQ
jgi:hypothetical protein